MSYAIIEVYEQFEGGGYLQGEAGRTVLTTDYLRVAEKVVKFLNESEQGKSRYLLVKGVEK